MKCMIGSEVKKWLIQEQENQYPMIIGEKTGIGQLKSIDDTSYNHYCLQQSLYKYILEKNYDLQVSKMYLVVIHPDYERYIKVEVPYLKNYVEYMLNTF